MGKQTSSKQWNILMLNARIHVQDRNTRGKVPSGKNRDSSCKGYIKWLCMARHETSLGYMDERQCKGSWLNKVGKAHDNAITT